MQQETPIEPAEVLSVAPQIYRQLPLLLKRNGFAYTLVYRTARVCIYEQAITENVKAYEVFVPRTTEAAILPSGNRVDACELFPRNEDFGYTAWSCATLEKALKRLQALEDKQQ
jgi:hypothetical protein